MLLIGTLSSVDGAFRRPAWYSAAPTCKQSSVKHTQRRNFVRGTIVLWDFVSAETLAASFSPILEQAATGYCDRYIRGDIQISTGRTMAVPLPRSCPLTRPPILPPIFVPPCHIQPNVIDVIILGRL